MMEASSTGCRKNDGALIALWFLVRNCETLKTKAPSLATRGGFKERQVSFAIPFQAIQKRSIGIEDKHANIGLAGEMQNF